jgi:LAS superfamily LD-carboxypeptidase LdcB
MRLELDPAELTGRARTHVVDLEAPPCTLHRAAVEPFLAMRAAAAVDGIDLVPVSSFRDFGRQAAIWNAKYRGERALLDQHGEPLDPSGLGEAELVEVILLWSALPGASRHHWGSEIDVIDAAAVPPEYRVALVPREFTEGAMFWRLDRWLERHMGDFGFFRPYATDRGGVRPEPWHLSYAPVSVPALAAISAALLRDAVLHEPIEGLAQVVERIERIHERYVARVDPPSGGALRNA